MNLRRKIAAVLLAATVGVTALPVNSFAQSLSTDSVTVEYNAAVAKPSYLIKGSKGVRKIKLSCSTSGATIYYTTNGKKPTTSSKKYSGGLLSVKKDVTIRAIAVKNGSVSAVMTKKIDVDTLKGDVTGNGKVDKADYTRFVKYKDGESSYVCKDNCDMNGDGKVTTKDINLLYEKLYGDDKADFEDDDSTVSASIKKPEMTVYKVYGGKSIKLSCGTSGTTIYYTTDGSKPDKYDYKYTGKFTVDRNCTVTAVAYKDGAYSAAKSRAVTVDKCANPTADKDTGVEYLESVKVTLNCATPSARICYTTDGSDPVRYGRIYKDPIELTENTTLKFYAECKGYSNSNVVTCNYRVKSSNYTISGRVWDDTMVSAPNGVYQSGEAGLNGITVMLLNTDTNKYEQTVTTTTINGVAGSYEITKCKPGNKYKVVFQFNGQKYRAHDAVVNGGNQAVSSSLPVITIKNGGAYSQTGTVLTTVNNYNSAITSNYFTTYATTNNTYTAAAQNVNLALRSNVYGNAELSFGEAKVTSAATGSTSTLATNGKIYSNDILRYTLTFANKSDNQILNASQLRIYVPEALEILSIESLGETALTVTNEGVHKNLHLDTYLVTCPKLLIGEELKIEIVAKVPAGVLNNTSVTCYAEVASYSYSSSCYDKNSIPGNFNGSVREKDEAASATYKVYTDATASQTISWTSGNNYAVIPVGTSRVLHFKIANGTSLKDFNVYVSNKNVISYVPTYTATTSGIDCMLVLTGEAAGSSNIVVTLSKDSSKYIDVTMTVA